MSVRDIINRAEGFVLVNALVIVFVLSLVAVEVMDGAGRRVGLIEVARGTAQAELLTDAGLAFAADLIERDDLGAGSDHRDESWALNGYIAEAGAGTVRITVRDLESRFNVNLLNTAVAEHAMQSLSRMAQATDATEVAEAAIASWFARQAGPETLPGTQARDEAFQAGDVIHLAQIADAAEPALRAQLTALPRGRAVNVNTATPDVLAAILGLDRAAIRPLLDQRVAKPFASVAAFQAALVGAAQTGLTAPAEILSVTSHWFEVETEARTDGTRHRARAILRRDPRTGAVALFAKSPARVGD